MMKTLKQTSAALMLALAVLASGCAADDEMKDTDPQDDGGQLITITVGTDGGADTRVSYDDGVIGSQDGYPLKWESGDQITITGLPAGESKIYTQRIFDLSSVQDGTIGTFTGEAINGATKYNVFYPVLHAGEPPAKAFSRKFPPQVQQGDNTTGHLKNCIFLEARDVTSLNNIQLNMVSSIMKFVLSDVPAEVGKLERLIWMVETADGDKSMEMTFENIKFNGSNTSLTAYLAFHPEEMKLKAGGKFTVILEGEKAYYAQATTSQAMNYTKGSRVTTAISNNSTWQWKPAFMVKINEQDKTQLTRFLDKTKYALKIGTWENYDSSPNQKSLEIAPLFKNGTVYFLSDLNLSANQRIWLCFPKMVKFFHTLTGDELSAGKLTLPSKNGGSTMKADNVAGNKYVNDWIVALYMGINVNGGNNDTGNPIYWASGNLIATQTEDGNVAFHIASAEDTQREAKPDQMVAYTTRQTGSQWDLYGWGDPTGKLIGEDNFQYQGDEQVSGTDKDIARVQLGGSWRLPTGSGTSELGAFSNMSDYGIDYEDWSNTWTTYKFKYKVNIIDGVTNILHFPAVGQFDGTSVVKRGDNMGTYRSGSKYFLSLEGRGNSIPYDGSTTCFYGRAVRPVTE